MKLIASHIEMCCMLNKLKKRKEKYFFYKLGIRIKTFVNKKSQRKCIRTQLFSIHSNIILSLKPKSNIQ